MHISFCLPKEHFPDQAWIRSWEQGDVLPLQEQGKAATSQCWIYQTWALLIQAGIPCSLVEGLPEHGGIIIAMSHLFPTITTPFKAKRKKSLKTASLHRNFFFVDIVADALPHPAAHLHLVQNRAHAMRLPRSIFMPHWPQPHLIPRNQARGSLFEKIAFFGDSNNLAPQLRSRAWQEKLSRKLGIVLEIRAADRWHDYSDVDGVIATRDFSLARHLHKPATKLYNAWLAHVPFIGGYDSAYAADGHPGRDYLVGGTPEEIFQHLKKLKEDLLFRKHLVTHGALAATAYTREATLERWKKLLQITLPKAVHDWEKKSKLGHFLFHQMQQLICYSDRVLR
jgi:hypothetical protein